jgi:hypothetical protein
MSRLTELMERGRRLAPAWRLAFALAVLAAVAVGIAAPDEFGLP